MRPVVLDAERLENLTGTIPIVTRLLVFPELVSTQDEARRLAEAGADAGTVVMANRQTEGRGSRGRHWYSPAGTGLYLSVILRPLGEPATLARWTLAASLAVCRACRECSMHAEIKWPNDILIRGRKAAGILAELRGAGDRQALILGIGVNVFQEPGDFPPEMAATCTSLRIEGGALRGREELAVMILGQLSTIAGLLYHGDWPQVRDDWIAMAPGITGEPVRVLADTGTAAALMGITAGVDEGGALIVRLEDGSTKVLHSSESLVRLEV